MDLTHNDKLNFNNNYNDATSISVVRKLSSCEKSSASPTEVWICDLHFQDYTKEVVIKFSNVLETDNSEEKLSYYNTLYGLKYETQVYEYIQRNIISVNECFNFVGYVGCLNPDSTKVQAFLGSDNLYTVLITEYKPVITFEEFLKTDILSEYKINIFSQLFYTLIVMEKHSLLHGDLHLSNMFVEELQEPEKMCLNIDGKQYAVVSKYILRIFDWDRSYCTQLKQNPISLHHRFTPKEDLRRVLTLLSYIENSPKELLDLMPKIMISVDDFKNSYDITRNGEYIITKTINAKYGTKNVEISPSRNVYKIKRSLTTVELIPYKRIIVDKTIITRLLKTSKRLTHSEKVHQTFERFLLNTIETDIIFGDKNPFKLFDHVDLSVYNLNALNNEIYSNLNDPTEHYSVCQVFGDTDESNIKKSLNTANQLFEKYNELIEDCKSDYSVSTRDVVISEKLILPDSFKIKKTSSPYELLSSLYVCTIVDTNSHPNLKKLLDCVLFYNFGKNPENFDLKFALNYNLKMRCKYDTTSFQGSPRDIFERCFNFI